MSCREILSCRGLAEKSCLAESGPSEINATDTSVGFFQKHPQPPQDTMLQVRVERTSATQNKCDFLRGRCGSDGQQQHCTRGGFGGCFVEGRSASRIYFARTGLPRNACLIWEKVGGSRARNLGTAHPWRAHQVGARPRAPANTLPKCCGTKQRLWACALRAKQPANFRFCPLSKTHLAAGENSSRTVENQLKTLLVATKTLSN